MYPARIIEMKQPSTTAVSRRQLPTTGTLALPGNSLNLVKSICERCVRISQCLVFVGSVACAILLAWPNDARAYHIPEHKHPDEGTPSLQESIRKKRAPGAIFVAIPVAYRYGIHDQGNLYCSPSIRATNSSNADIEELIIGIDYVGGAGEWAGATITRYSDIKVRRQDTHYFYQLTVTECKNIVGEVSVIRCVFTSGEDCSSLVKAINFGAVPLRMKSR